MARYCGVLVKLESKVWGLNSKSIWNDWCGAPHFDRWVTKPCCMQGFSDFSWQLDFPVLQPVWGILQEVWFPGDDEGQVKKPISLHWLQRKPQVIKLDIDIKFLDSSLSHFKSLEDYSSYLKICTWERSDELSCEMAISLYWPQRQFKVNSLDWDIYLLYVWLKLEMRNTALLFHIEWIKCHDRYSLTQY